MTEDPRIRQVANANSVSIAIARAAVTQVHTSASDNDEARLIKVGAVAYDALSNADAYSIANDSNVPGGARFNPATDDVRVHEASEAIRRASAGMGLNQTEIRALSEAAVDIGRNYDQHGR